MKKLFATFLALVMMLSLVSVSAFAATPAPTKDGHTYKAYQIFSGTQDKDAAELGNIKWGDGINAEGFLAALQSNDAFKVEGVNVFAKCVTAADVAKAMENWADKSDNARAFAKLAEDYVKGTGTVVVNHQSELEAGYYLVVDTTESVAADDAKNVALLQLTKKGTFEIAQKNEVPEVKKEVSDEGALKCDKTHAHTKDCYTWTDSNNVALGDTVHYKIETAVPATASEYEYYFFIVNDTLSKGLTYTADSVKVYIDGTQVAATTDYTVKVSGQNIQVALVDAIGNAGKSVVVTYDAVLNEEAMIGVAGNPNAVDVKYSNNPNEDFKPGEKPNDGFPEDDTHTPKGETPKDYTITYTTQVKLFKVDENTKPLNGAEFTLSGDTVNKVLVYKEVFTAVADGGEYYKLKNGTYTKEAPTADTMKAAEAGATAGYVVDADATGEGVVKVDGVTYRPYVPATDDGKDIFVLVKGDADQYESTEQMYKMESKFEEQTATGEAKNVVAMVDENGEVMFTGLSAGTYTLSETKTPAGYNTIAEPIKFTINWAAPEEGVTTGNEKCTWSVAEGDTSGVEYVEADQAFELTIKNEKGTTLPETGGIGTTIFYAVGGILLVGAAVMLVAKKRMESEN